MKANLNNVKKQAEEFAKNMTDIANLMKELRSKYSEFEERLKKLEDLHK